MTKSKLSSLFAVYFVLAATHCNSAPADKPQFCWGEVSGEVVSNPDLLAKVSISATDQQVWASWEESNSIKVGTQVQGRWTVQSILPGEVAGSANPVLRASRNGDVFLARRSQSCSTDLRISRWRNGVWLDLGSPQGTEACKKDATNAEMVIDDLGRPVLVWESRTGESVRYLYVARWNGSTWSRLGAPIPTKSEAYSLEPSVAVRSGQVWIAWVDGKERQTHVRIAHWNGKGWRDLGNSRSGNLKLDYSTRHPKITVRPDGEVLVAWLNRGHPATALAVAQWKGNSWRVSSLFQSALQVGSLSMAMGKYETPLISWTVEDSGLNDSVSVWQLGTDGWSEVVGGLHFSTTPSGIRQASMAADKNGEIYLIWLEDQDNGASRHIVHVYPCEQGEAPKQLPQRPSRQSLWPQTLEAAVKYSLDAIDSESKEKLRLTKKADLAKFHFGWGMSIRNNFGLWMGNTALLQSCGQGQVIAADTCSTIIMEQVWERLQR